MSEQLHPRLQQLPLLLRRSESELERRTSACFSSSLSFLVSSNCHVFALDIHSCVYPVTDRCLLVLFRLIPLFECFLHVSVLVDQKKRVGGEEKWIRYQRHSLAMIRITRMSRIEVDHSASLPWNLFCCCCFCLVAWLIFSALYSANTPIPPPNS